MTALQFEEVERLGAEQVEELQGLDLAVGAAVSAVSAVLVAVELEPVPSLGLGQRLLELQPQLALPVPLVLLGLLGLLGLLEQLEQLELVPVELHLAPPVPPVLPALPVPR